MLSEQEMQEQFERFRQMMSRERERADSESDHHRHRDRSSRPGACPTEDSEERDWRIVSSRTSRKKR